MYPLTKMVTTAACILSAVMSHGAIQLVNDPALPASADGFNLTRDTETNLEWLDVDVSAGRTFADLVGDDGTNEFAPGGDFAGFRFATKLELTGAVNGPQLPSLYRSLGVSPFGFSSIGGYSQARAVISIAGCFASCTAHGYTYGNILQDDRITPSVASMEAFTSQGSNWGRSSPNAGPIMFPPNDTFAEQRGNWLVRPVAGTDADGDLIPDVLDNCIDVSNPLQIDVGNDGHSNACDPDLDNNCIVNAADLGILRGVFFANYPIADFNSDGVVNLIDLGVMRALFFNPPGPSGGGLCTP
ncbi:MAG: hypothetical protein AB8G17_21730 [Gammaproteobacteria bacterium]